MRKVKRLVQKDFFKTSVVDISKSGKYMVRSGLYKIFLTDFATNKRLNAVKGYGYILRGISEDDKYCLFTSNGETQINILSLPDLNEVAYLNVYYAFALMFWSDSEVAFLCRENIEDDAYEIKIWDFITGEIRCLIDNLNMCTHGCTLLDGKGFYLPCVSDDPNDFGKYRMITKNGLVEYQIPQNLCFDPVSQPHNNKIISYERLETQECILGVYDLTTQKFTPISKSDKCREFVYWLSDDIFLFSDNNMTGIMNLNGDITKLADVFTFLFVGSNDKYIMCYNPFGTYLYEKIFEDEESEADRSKD